MRGLGRDEIDNYWSQEAVDARAQDEVDSWLPLPAAAARCGISPVAFESLAEEGLADVRPDRGGRLRISLEEAQRVRKFGKDPRYHEVDHG